MPSPQPSSAGSAPPSGPPPRLTVFLPCHTLDDFPTALEEREADDLLAAWVAAWHPALLARSGGPPVWASVDLPPPAEAPLVGIVPASHDARFAAQFDASAGDSSCWVRATRGADEITAAAARCCGIAAAADGLPGAAWSRDFQALGLTVLVGELIARRMRSTLDLESAGFGSAAVAAARAACAGDDAATRESLERCFGCLRACRDRFYPVDVWLIDVVLAAGAAAGPALAAELESPVPLAVVAPPRTLVELAGAAPELASRLRAGVAAGTIEVCGGPLDPGPLEARVPEELLESLSGGRDACREVAAAAPATFARRGGGGSAILPRILADLGYTAAIWDTFDGRPQPDPGGGFVRWEGVGGGAVDVVGRPPLDARAAATILGLPQRIGDAMDHDHVAVVTFARHAGTASVWHGLLQRAARWGTALGTFVTPGDLVARVAGSAAPVSFGGDTFPPTLPGGGSAAGDEVGGFVDAASTLARRIVREAAAVRGLLPPAAGAAPAPGRVEPEVPSGLVRWWRPRSRGDDLAIDNGAIRLQVHRGTGGILSLRGPDDRGNRLSQRLAVRQAGVHGGMQADSVERVAEPSGPGAIVSRGRLLDGSGREAGRFTQRVALAAGLPVARIEVELHLAAPLGSDLLERHAACRFAWHENEDVEIRRSVHAQAITTERTRFTAPHFVEIRGAGPRAGAAGPVTILCGGLPWHVRSSPHVLDTILAGGGTTRAVRRLAVAVGLERPWDLALEWTAADSLPAALGDRAPWPANVRLTADAAASAGGATRARVGLVESAGRAGNVRVAWARPVVAARACGLDGRPRTDVAVAIEGCETVVWLRPYEWLHLDLEFLG